VIHMDSGCQCYVACKKNSATTEKPFKCPYGSQTNDRKEFEANMR